MDHPNNPTMNTTTYQRYSSPTSRGGIGAPTNNNNIKASLFSNHHPTSPPHATTDLHRACSSPSSSLSKLRATLLALGKNAAAIKDEQNNLPLHLLGRNELLIHLFLNQARYDTASVWDNTTTTEDDPLLLLRGVSAGSGAAAGIAGGSGASRPPRTELDSFVVELVRAHPRSVIMPDASGRIPLVDAIYDWIEFACGEHDPEWMMPAREDGGGDDDRVGGRGRKNVAGGGGGRNGMESGAGGGGSARLDNTDRPSSLGMGSARGGGGGNNTTVGNNNTLGIDKFEGMSQLMGQDETNGNKGEQRGENSTNRTGRRSILDNISLPNAFRSAYSASGKVMEDGQQATSRANYRNAAENNNNISNLGDDPAARQQAEFRNVWSATVPRPDGPSDEGRGRGAGGSTVSGRGRGNVAAPSLGEDEGALDDIFPLNLAMPPIAEWSLRMISLILEGIESYDGPLGAADDGEAFGSWREKRNGMGRGDRENDAGLTSGDSSWIGNSLVSSIATIPSFMKTLLLLSDNDPVKSRVFNLTIVRRVISSKYAIGNWLVYMLEAVDPIVARRGVDYLEILSEDEDENALIPSTKRVRFAGTQLSPMARASLYYKVSQLDYFLPAILALEDTSEVDRAAKTKLLRHILDKELGSRATLTMAFFDLFFLLLLVVTFQMSVYHVIEGYEQDVKYTTTFFLSMICVLYAILRKFGQMSSMIKISRQAFAENNFRWVDAIDWLAILLVFGGIVWMAVAISTNYVLVPVTDYMKSYLAAAVCAVWLKLISWLSVINWQVINLVNLFYEIVRGIRWILLFLLIAIFASSQMFYIMLSGENCDDNGFCEKKNAYLQVWAILLGQFDVTEYSTTFSVIAFVSFTFVAFVILGYALIATSIDLYNKAVTFRSENSAYGNRSRLVYIAELRAFRRLFDQRWTVMQYCAALLFLTSSVVIFLFSASTIREMLGQYYSGGIMGGALALLLLFLFVSITAFVSHMTYYSFVEESGATGCVSAICRCLAANLIVRFFSNPIERFMRFVVDIDGIHLDGTPSTAKYTDSWQGSATHVRCHIKRMLMQTEARLALKLKHELFVMEMRHKKANESSRSDVLMEIRASEERMGRILNDFQGWMERRTSKEE